MPGTALQNELVAGSCNRSWNWVLSVVVYGVEWGGIEDAELELGDPRDRSDLPHSAEFDRPTSVDLGEAEGLEGINSGIA